MNKLALQGVQDFALTTDALAFMQSAFESFEQFGNLGGENIIVSGCVVTGSSVSSGWMFIKGKLMPFLGGSIQTNVRIVETVDTVNVDVASRQQTTYYAEFGTAVDPNKNIPWSTLYETRNSNLRNKVDKLEGSRLMLEEEGEKLAGISENANNYVHPSDPSHTISEIEGLSTELGKKLEVLVKGSHNIGDISSDGRSTISLGTTLADSNYVVLGSIVWNEDIVHNSGGMSWTVVSKSTNSFVIHLHEDSSSVQNVRFEYVLIRL